MALVLFEGLALIEWMEAMQRQARNCDLAGAATAEEDAASARRGARSVTGNCESRHLLTGHAGEGALTDLTTPTRAQLGLGDGLFRVGYDLRFRHPNRGESQAVATVMRAGCLLLDGATD